MSTSRQLTVYEHRGGRTNALITANAGTVLLTVGHDTERGYASVSAPISPDSARHIAALLLEAADDA